MSDATLPLKTVACRLHVDHAGTGWTLLLQSGVLLTCTVGIALRELMLRELGIAQPLFARIDVLLLDGKPVDHPERAIVRDGARIALAAGLPGIAGLAMKSNSAVRGLRPGITHGREGEELPAGPRPGGVELALFSLALPLLGEHFLGKGVLVGAPTLLRYMRHSLTGDCVLDGRALSLGDLRDRLEALTADSLVFLSAALRR